MRDLGRLQVTKKRIIRWYGPLFFGIPLAMWQALTHLAEAPTEGERPLLGAIIILIGALVLGYAAGACFGWMWWTLMRGNDD